MESKKTTPPLNFQHLAVHFDFFWSAFALLYMMAIVALLLTVFFIPDNVYLTGFLIFISHSSFAVAGWSA